MPARFIFSFALFAIISSGVSIPTRILSMRSLVLFIELSKCVCLQSGYRQPNEECKYQTNNARGNMQRCESALYRYFLIKNSSNSILFHLTFLLYSVSSLSVSSVESCTSSFMMTCSSWIVATFSSSVILICPISAKSLLSSL